MDVGTALNTSNNLSSTSDNTTKSEEDKAGLIETREDFLTILLAQLKHQDPLNPMEGTEFIDSITRLSSVEQDINQNANLEKIIGLLGGDVNLGTPVSYLDKEVEFISSEFNLEDNSADIFYELEEGVEEVSVIITNSSGTPVFTAQGSTDVGRNKFTWDGKDNDGNQLKDDVYSVSIAYPGEEGLFNTVDTSVIGVVKEANIEDGEVVLVIGGVKASLEDIIAIRSKENEVAQIEE